MTKKIFYYAHRITGELVSVTNPINPANDAMFVPLEQEWLENYFATADVDFHYLPPEKLAHAIAMDLANEVNPPATIPSNLTKIDLNNGDTLRLGGDGLVPHLGFKIGNGAIIDINSDDIRQITALPPEFGDTNDFLTTIAPFAHGAAVGDQQTALAYALSAQTQSPVEIENKPKEKQWWKWGVAALFAVAVLILAVVANIVFAVSSWFTLPALAAAGWAIGNYVQKK